MKEQNDEVLNSALYDALKKSIRMGAADECWPAVSNAKHPRIQFKGKVYYCRRLAYQFEHGRIAAGLHVQSKCGSERCCNPRHLFSAPPRATTDQNVAVRFYAKVNKTEGCWAWLGSSCGGYGVFRFRGRPERAHRVAYQLEVGPIPPGRKTMLCHKCNNGMCVRIDANHVYLGTGVENAIDRKVSGTTARGKTHGSRTKPASIKKGELNGRAELREQDVQIIRKTWQVHQGKRGLIRALARYFDKNETSIKDIVDRRLWKHLPPPPDSTEALSFSQIAKVPIHGGFSTFSKITNQEVREMRFLFQQAAGRRGALKRLAERYSMKISQISRLVNYKCRSEIVDDFQTLLPLVPLFANDRTNQRLHVIKGYPGNEAKAFTYSAVPNASAGILSGMLISLDNNGQWVKGVPAGKTPYLAYHDQTDPDVVSSGKLLGLSCAGDFEVETGYYNTGQTYAIDTPLIAGTSGQVGNVDKGNGLTNSGAAIVGFASAPAIDTTKTNSEGSPVGGPTAVLRFRTRWIPVVS